MTRPDWLPEGWPDLPADEAEYKKIAYQAVVDVHKTKAGSAPPDRIREAFEADEKLEGTLFQGYHESIRDLAKSNASRLETSAETVQKAAAALTGLYTALLGFVYAVGEIGLPPRALLPAVFLGMAVILSTGYVSYLKRPEDVGLAIPGGVPRGKVFTQTRNFILWSRSRYLSRASWIRAAVVSLAFALVLLPAPLLSSAMDTGGEIDVPSSPPWPALPEPDVSEAGVVLYEAQVAEVAALREGKSPPAPPHLSWPYETLIWLIAVAGLVWVWFEWRREDPAATGEGTPITEEA